MSVSGDRPRSMPPTNLSGLERQPSTRGSRSVARPEASPTRSPPTLTRSETSSFSTPTAPACWEPATGSTVFMGRRRGRTAAEIRITPTDGWPSGSSHCSADQTRPFRQSTKRHRAWPKLRIRSVAGCGGEPQRKAARSMVGCVRGPRGGRGDQPRERLQHQAGMHGMASGMPKPCRC